ncbi:MAG: M23 family metallopeptidase, partial [Anaerolineae bacterium]
MLRAHVLVPCSVVAAVLALAAPTRARAAPGHDWGYPFCGPQPDITAVYDHEYPTYNCPPNGNASCKELNGILRLYNNDLSRGRFDYDGHNGWDYRTRSAAGVNVKRRVYAAADGVVTFAGWHHPGGGSGPKCDAQVRDHEKGYGLMIRVRHGNEEILYGHLSAALIRVGDSVSEGDIIGTTGSTGNSTGPHLHFGAFRPSGPTMANSFDPYGWNADWRGVANSPLPKKQDPWFAYSGKESVRRILPGAPDNEGCPTGCGAAVVVDDLDPG